MYNKLIHVISFFFFSFCANAQVFWTENFNNGCTANCAATAYSGVNGAWTQTILGAEGVDANRWYVSCAENGHTAGICGTACKAASATATLASLHVGAAPTFFGDIGAAYDASSCGTTCPPTNRRIESPVVNCTGKSGIYLTFNYIEAGQGTTDDATVWYYDGTTWALLVNTPKTVNTGCGGQGRWTQLSTALPATADNNPAVRIGFLWVNNADGVGTDPSFAVDNMTLSVGVLAVKLLDFTAVPKGRQVSLAWRTAAESESDYFEVERSADGVNFQPLPQHVKAKGYSSQETNYQLFDAGPLPGKNYYRLAEFSIDGTKSEYSIVTVLFDGGKSISVYPNPTTGISRVYSPELIQSFRLLNSAGTVLKRIQQANILSAEIDLTDLSPGIYFAEVNTIAGKKVLKILKE